MNKKIIVTGILSVLSFGVMAETPSFNNVKIGYTSELGGDSIDGFEVQGEFELSEAFYINAEYTDLSFEDIIKVDFQVYTIGLGYKQDISKYSTLFGEINYVNVDSKARFNEGDINISESFSQDGYEVQFGIRSIVSESFELNAAVVYVDYDDDDDGDFYTAFGGIYKFSENFGVYADLETDFSDENYAVGIRYQF